MKTKLSIYDLEKMNVGESVSILMCENDSKTLDRIRSCFANYKRRFGNAKEFHSRRLFIKQQILITRDK